MKVYIIEGRTGEYSDVSTWVVRGYLSPAAAEQGRDELNARAVEVSGRWEELRFDWSEEGTKKKRELAAYVGDDQFDMAYDKTVYYLVEVDIVDLGWPEKENA